MLIHYRARYCRALAEYAAQAHYECSGQREELELRYQTVSTVHDPFLPQEQLFAALMEHQQSHEQAEIASRLCLSGPHKDDLEVLVNGRSARQFCSQGQVRTAALALKLADREIHRNTMGEYPIMLLDDVLSRAGPAGGRSMSSTASPGGRCSSPAAKTTGWTPCSRGKVFHIRGRGGADMSYLHHRQRTSWCRRRTHHRHFRSGQHLPVQPDQKISGADAEKDGVRALRLRTISPKSFLVCDHPYHKQHGLYLPAEYTDASASARKNGQSASAPAGKGKE